MPPREKNKHTENIQQIFLHGIRAGYIFFFFFFLNPKNLGFPLFCLGFRHRQASPVLLSTYLGPPGITGGHLGPSRLTRLCRWPSRLPLGSSCSTWTHNDHLGSCSRFLPCHRSSQWLLISQLSHAAASSLGALSVFSVFLNSRSSQSLSALVETSRLTSVSISVSSSWSLVGRSFGLWVWYLACVW